MKKLTIRDITLKYIRENYNVNKERKSTEQYNHVKNIDLNQCGAMYKQQPKGEFFKWLANQMKDSTHIEIEIDYDSTELCLYKSTLVEERDQQVYNRLQKEKKLEIQAENKESKQRAEYERLKGIYEQ